MEYPLLPTTQVINYRFKTSNGLGLGKFYHAKTGKLLLDETKGVDVEPQHTLFKGSAKDFGALRNLL